MSTLVLPVAHAAPTTSLRRLLVAADTPGLLVTAARVAEQLGGDAQLLAVAAARAPIAHMADDWSADLVVLDRNARRTLGTLTNGRSRGSLHAGGRPVLALAPEADGVVRRAVVGVDFGAASTRAAALARRLVAPGGVLSLVHVHDPACELDAPNVPTWDDPGAGPRLQRLAVSVRHDTPELPRPDVRVGTATLFGDVPAELVDYARRVGAELLAIGAGPVAAQVLRQARELLPNCSVLVT